MDLHRQGCKDAHRILEACVQVLNEGEGGGGTVKRIAEKDDGEPEYSTESEGGRSSTS